MSNLEATHDDGTIGEGGGVGAVGWLEPVDGNVSAAPLQPHHINFR